MVAKCEDELICDFAETYRILDWRGLPLKLAATLAAGLPHEGRVYRMLRGGDEFPMDTILYAAILDQLRIANWFQTKDGQEGKNRPQPILNVLMGGTKPKKTHGFSSPDEFEAWRSRFTGGN